MHIESIACFFQANDIITTIQQSDGSLLLLEWVKFQALIKFSSRTIVLDTGASNAYLDGRHIEAMCLKFNQVLFYGAVRHALTWTSTWSAWYPAVQYAWCVQSFVLSSLDGGG